MKNFNVTKIRLLNVTKWCFSNLYFRQICLFLVVVVVGRGGRRGLVP